jgi:hypothetical protein
MKKLLTLCFLVSMAFTSNAQTFEETVDYLNNIIKENENVNYFPGSISRGRSVLGIVVNKTGRVTVYDDWNDKLDREITEYVKPIGVFNLFDFEKCGIEEGNFIIILDKNSLKLGMFSSLIPVYSPKIEKALKHLRSLCTKEQDLFGN